MLFEGSACVPPATVWALDACSRSNRNWALAFSGLART